MTGPEVLAGWVFCDRPKGLSLEDMQVRIWKASYSKPLPEGAVIVKRRTGDYAKFRNKRGKLKEAKLTENGDRILLETAHWQIGFKDHLGRKQMLKGFTDRLATQRLADRIQDLLNQNANNQPLSEDIHRWLEKTPTYVREALMECGLLDLRSASAGKPLLELIREYAQNLTAKERSPEYVKRSARDLKFLFEGCHFRNWSQIQAGAVATFLKRLRDDGISIRRSNAYLTAAKGFCSWMVSAGYAGANPVAHVKPLNVALDRRRVRRALGIDEFRRFLRTAAEGPERFGLSGYERYLIYRLVAETGLRAGEVRSLNVSSFDFDSCTVSVVAACSKRRREDSQCVSPNLASEIRAFFANKTPGAKAFGGRYPALTDQTSDMVKADLEAAGIAPVDENGRVFDFHALRGQCATLLAASGVHPKTAQVIMRHSDINLTMLTYAHTLRGQEQAAVTSLPDLSLEAISQEAQLKTGTDGPADTPKSLPKACLACGPNRTGRDTGGQTTPHGASKTRFLSPPKGTGGAHNPLATGSNPVGPNSVPYSQALLQLFE